MALRTTDFRTTETGSYWGSAPAQFRPALTRDVHADVAIIGAGYTGLWTAYYLLERDPHLRVAVVEAEHAGFGASGRNGGWCSALFPVSLATLAREHGRDAAIAQYRAMQGSVREIGRVVEAEGIDCDWALGGTIVLARSQPQLARAEAEFAESARFGFGVEDVALLDGDQAREHVNATGVVGGVYTPHCAAIHPRKLVRSLADVVTARGATVYEHSRVVSVEPGCVRTRSGHGAGRRDRARHRGLHREPARSRARPGPGLLADDRHRAAVRRRCGTRSGWPAGRRSPTSGT